jgi:hypothetical protein
MRTSDETTATSPDPVPVTFLWRQRPQSWSPMVWPRLATLAMPPQPPQWDWTGKPIAPVAVTAKTVQTVNWHSEVCQTNDRSERASMAWGKCV